MQVDYGSIVKDLFGRQTSDMFRKYIQKRSQRNMMGKMFNDEEDDGAGLQISSQTNQTNTIRQQQPKHLQQQSIENVFKSLSGSQVLKIYADSSFFKQLLSNKQQYPREIDQILWRITYLLGQLLMQIQSYLIEHGYLQNSVVWSMKQVKQAAYQMVQLQLRGQQGKEMQEMKVKMVEIFERGGLSIQELVRVYNVVVGIWKRPLEMALNLQQHNKNNVDMYMHIQPITSTTNNPYNPLEYNSLSHKTQTNITTPKPMSSKLPPKIDLNAIGDNLQVSQVKPFNPKQKQPAPGKKAIQNKIKRAKGKIQAAERPLNLYNRKIRQKFISDPNISQMDLQKFNLSQLQQYKATSILQTTDKQTHPPTYNSKTTNRTKTVHDKKLEAVKAKMAILNNQPHKVMDLCKDNDKIVLNQNRNRIINRQMNGFRPAIMTQANLSVQQKIMKGSFGPNFNNKMMVPASSEKRMGKQHNNHQQNMMGGSMQLSNINIEQDNQIIQLNPNRTTSVNHNKSNKDNIKLQEKLEQPTSLYNKSDDKLNLPQDILRSNNIQPITIPIIANNNNPTHPHNQLNQNNQQKELIRRMRQRWGQQEQKILIQNFIQKGDQTDCSRQLQQVYGASHPKHSPVGVRVKIEGIVRKVYQKFCSLNTKNESIRKFKQNFQFIRKKSSMPVRRRIYKQILVIYTAMLNMSEQKRQIISSKVTQINRICQQEMARNGLVPSNGLQPAVSRTIDVQ